jgi:hypothetical protein
MSLAWMVVYPRSDKTIIDIAEVIDYEQRDYSLASETRFESEVDAANYAWELSLKSKIPVNQYSHSKQLWILDREQ